MALFWESRAAAIAIAEVFEVSAVASPLPPDPR
jgi:hypothetical protein